MNDKTIHDLAVAYAQAELIITLQKDPGLIGYDETLRSFIKSYHHALNQIPIEAEEVDETF